MKELANTASSILNIPKQAFSVIMRENNPDNIGVDGVQFSEMHNNIREA
ncbi:tautomerase family protein [Thermoanaerobacterium thermosaccharolyticum]|nr:tautomerase family protein [Thermoanaerobacterium thermosaccharolyticum]